MQKIIDIILSDPDLVNVNFTWHGGEPLLMGKNLFRKVLDYQESRKTKCNYTNIIQTNGMLLDSEWFEIFEQHDVSLGISIDGGSYNLNSSRFEDKDTFNKVLLNITHAKEYNNIYLALYATLTNCNLEHIDEILNYFKEVHPDCISIVPIIDDQEYISAIKWAELLKKLDGFTDETGILNNITTHIHQGVSEMPPQHCTLDGTCNKFISMDPSGDIFSTCTVQSSKTYICNINDKSCWKDVLSKINEPLTDHPNSIYHQLNDLPRYRYFQGTGCIPCRNESNNEQYLQGIVKYIDETFTSTSDTHGKFKIER